VGASLGLGPSGPLISNKIVKLSPRPRTAKSPNFGKREKRDFEETFWERVQREFGACIWAMSLVETLISIA
jgi:hypothetical protein